MSETVISHRFPGQYTRESMLRLRMRCLLVLGVFAVVTDVLGRILKFQGIEFQLAELALLLVCLAIVHFAVPVVERLDQGAAGEELVGRLLDELSVSGWHVMHDAQLGTGNVDHVAVGPPGLFTFETKSSPKPVRVRRLHGAIIRQAQVQRERVERVAGVRAEPFVVFSQAWVDSPGTRRKGVRVVPARMLLSHLRRRPPALSPDQVSDIQRRLRAALSA
jgi:hypothetical protein